MGFTKVTLEPPDSHHLMAALGWLELGNPSEAGEEIARMEPQWLTHPDVLDVRWQICASGARWEAALELAEELVRLAPDRAIGWIHRAYAMRRAPQGGLPQAFAALRPAHEKFPKEAIIPYNLSCYMAQMGKLDDAWEWLCRAIARGTLTPIKEMALADSDLEPLWHRIRRL